MDELVSFLADQASTNLPDQVEALSRARKEHASATADVQASLAELEDKLEKVKEVNQELADQRKKVITNMCIMECDRDETKQRLIHLKKELSEAAEEGILLTGQIKQKEIENETSEKTYKECVQRMDAYKKSVEKFEESLPDMTELDNARKKLSSLQEERDEVQRDLNLLSGSREDCWDNVKDDIKRNIQDLEISLKKRNVLVEKLEAKLKDRQRGKNKLETANMILKNRNSALLIRLKRQVDQQKKKFEQLINHIGITEDRLNLSKARLEKITEQ
ncbi:hypothetical protein RRG08_002181 [Elysia crispata]|uniref:Uncharacterized protein n=1 Tax=Elysia crispata TaxID=231223 RepID=A0AAE0ZAQ8_9GAST|nr:hypothetical protein RRG08_002181 [Elysia crispata]